MNTDVDECTLNTHNCEHTCENTIGSFLCGCNAGYELISDGRTCEGMNKIINFFYYNSYNHFITFHDSPLENKQVPSLQFKLHAFIPSNPHLISGVRTCCL